MAGKRRITVDIIGDADQFKKALGQSSTAVTAFGKDADKAGKKTGKLKGGFAALGGPVGAVAAGVGVGVAVNAIKGFISAASESEVSQKKMKTQLKASGISWDKHSGQIDKVIQKHSALSGFDDEDLQDSFTNLVRTTGSVNRSFKLNALAMDIARAKGISLEAASKLVAKAAGGQETAFSRVGIQMGKNATASDAIAEAQRRFAGQAEAYGKTSAGAQQRFGVAIESVKEVLGAKLLPILTTVANAVATFVLQMQSGEGIGGRFAAALSGIGAVIGTVVTALVDAGTAIVTAVGDTADWLGRRWDDVKVAAETTWGLIKTAIVTPVSDAITWIRTAVKDVKTWLGDRWDDIKTVASAAWGGIKSRIVTPVDNAITFIRNAVNGDNGIIAWLGARWEDIKGTAETAWRAVKNNIVNPIGNAVDAVRGALGNQEGGLLYWLGERWKDFKDAADDLARPFVRAFGRMSNAVEDVLGFLGDIVEKVRDAIDWIGKIRLPKINIPFIGGSGGGNVGPGKGGPFPNVQAIADASLGWGLSGGRGRGQGYRPGDDGWHGQDRARDLSGPASAMMGFAQMLYSTMGSKLLELIYTPMVTGIKNGKPVNIQSFYGAAVAADHYDHVHVAMKDGGLVKRGGWAVVGEEGPELARLPSGSRVYSNRDSERMAPSRDGGNIIMQGPVYIGSRRAAEVAAQKFAHRLANG